MAERADAPRAEREERGTDIVRGERERERGERERGERVRPSARTHLGPEELEPGAVGHLRAAAPPVSDSSLLISRRRAPRRAPAACRAGRNESAGLGEERMRESERARERERE